MRSPASTCARISAVSGASVAVQAPTQSAIVDTSSSMPSRAKVSLWRFSGKCCPNFASKMVASSSGPVRPRAMGWNGAGGWLTVSHVRHAIRSRTVCTTFQCRGTTAANEAPGASTSATIRSFFFSRQRRRRSAPVMISIQTPAPDLNSARTSAAKITNQGHIRQAVPAGRIRSAESSVALTRTTFSPTPRLGTSNSCCGSSGIMHNMQCDREPGARTGTATYAGDRGEVVCTSKRPRPLRTDSSLGWNAWKLPVSLYAVRHGTGSVQPGAERYLHCCWTVLAPSVLCDAVDFSRQCWQTRSYT
jgi:hypothetical protein